MPGNRARPVLRGLRRSNAPELPAQAFSHSRTIAGYCWPHLPVNPTNRSLRRPRSGRCRPAARRATSHPSTCGRHTGRCCGSGGSHVCTTARSHTVVIASPSPRSPSQPAMHTSATPRFFSSMSTASQNRARPCTSCEGAGGGGLFRSSWGGSARRADSAPCMSPSLTAHGCVRPSAPPASQSGWIGLCVSNTTATIVTLNTAQRMARKR